MGLFDNVNERIVWNSNKGPAFDDFCRLLTDGENMYVEKRIVVDYGDWDDYYDGYRVGPDGLEQALFEGQTGCFNGVDLQGNYISNIALEIADSERVYSNNRSLFKSCRSDSH
jgi:hypothetical protein